jgi:hypothetical protein
MLACISLKIDFIEADKQGFAMATKQAIYNENYASNICF